MECHIGIVLEKLRDIDLKHQWEHKLELREVPMMEYQEVVVLVTFSDP